MTEFISLQYDHVELLKKNPTFFPGYMRMCRKVNSHEKSGWQAHNGLRNFTLRVTQQKIGI